MLEILAQEDIVLHAAEMDACAQQRDRELERHLIVGDVRDKGLMLEIEFVQDRQAKTPYPAERR